jgi:hypothetical protein
MRVPMSMPSPRRTEATTNCASQEYGRGAISLPRSVTT